MRSVAIILFSLLAVSAWAQAPIYRQFFTTNPAPVVDVVAGSNATVQASTPAANIRRFTVNAVPSASGYASNVFGTNVIGAVAEATHATNADYASYSGYATNAGYSDYSGYATNAGYADYSGYATNAGYADYAGYATNAGTASAGWPTNWALSSITNANNLTNWASIPTNYVPPQATHATNADNATYVTTATLTNQIDTTSVIGDAIYGGTILATNGYASGPLTVATLPGAPSNGQMVWCSDVVTTRGTGDYVYYDGASWRTREHVVATADILQWMLNANGILGCKVSPIMEYASQIHQGNQVGTIARTSANAGASSLIAYFNSSTYGPYIILDCGVAADGVARIYGTVFYTMAQNTTNGCGSAVSVSALCNETEKYIALFGHASATTTNYPTTGCFFLYDMYTNVMTSAPAGASSSYTNNWICVSANSSTYAYADSGLPVSTSLTAPERLSVIVTASAVYFYTNGVACYTHTTGESIPSAANLYHLKHEILKTAGTTARALRQWAPWMCIVHPARIY